MSTQQGHMRPTTVAKCEGSLRDLRTRNNRPKGKTMATKANKRAWAMLREPKAPTKAQRAKRLCGRASKLRLDILGPRMRARVDGLSKSHSQSFADNEEMLVKPIVANSMPRLQSLLVRKLNKIIASWFLVQISVHISKFSRIRLSSLRNIGR